MRIGNVTERFFGTNRRYQSPQARSFGNSCRTSRRSVEIQPRVCSLVFASFAEVSSWPPVCIIEVAAIGTAVRTGASDPPFCSCETAEFRFEGMIRTFHCLSGETSVWSQGFLNQQTAIIHEED